MVSVGTHLVILAELWTLSYGLLHQYHFVTENKTWSEAQKFCRDNYTDLATVTNIEEMNQIISIADSNSFSGDAWIGLYNDVNSWRWSLSNTTFFGPGESEFRMWASGQPNNLGGRQTCGEISSYGRWWDKYCGILKAFICYDQVDSSIRLANSSGYCSGRVEIYHNGTWGTVCDDLWDMNDAEVVCRQLGCGKAVRAPRKAYFGQGSGKTWLDDVGCTGNESSITQCSHNGFGIENCGASEEAGVVCVGNMKTPTLVLLTTNTAFLPGKSAEFRCAITSHRPMTANFRLYRNGRYMQTKAADQKMVTFSLSTMASSDKGNYTCDYYYQGERNVSSSKSNAITITIVTVRSKQIVRVEFQVNSSLPLSDAEFQERLMDQIRRKLQEKGLPADAKLTWKKQPDGQIFHKKNEKEKKERRRKRKSKDEF